MCPVTKAICLFGLVLLLPLLSEGNDVSQSGGIVPPCTPDIGCRIVDGKRIFVVAMSSGMSGNDICAAQNMTCAGVPVFSPPSAACSAFHPTANVTSSLNGWRQSVFCFFNSGLACLNQNSCHDCPLCDPGLSCGITNSILFEELFVECVPLIFADGLESGDASAWSAVVPPLSDRCALLPGEPVGGCATGDECYWIGNTSTCGTPYCQVDPDTGIDYMCNHGDRCDDGGFGYFLNVCFKGKSCVPWNAPIGPLCSKLCRVSLDILNSTDLDFPTVVNRNGDPSYPCWRDDDGFTGLEDNPLPAADCVPFVHATSALYSLSGEAGIPDGYDLPLDLGVCLDYSTFGEYYVPQAPRVAPNVTLTPHMIEALLGRLDSTPWSATPK